MDSLKTCIAATVTVLPKAAGYFLFPSRASNNGFLTGKEAGNGSMVIWTSVVFR
jgi:hypothetical protein